MLPSTVAHIAQGLELPVADIEAATTANARTLFHI